MLLGKFRTSGYRCAQLAIRLFLYVEAPDKSSSKRKQKIHICYDLVGFVPLKG